MKLSLKKQQEREIIYISMHCALNEKSYNPYYTFLLQKFCEYDRRFRVRKIRKSEIYTMFKMLKS